VLNSNGATAHMVLLPAPPSAIVPGCDACACDLDGAIAGVDTGVTGGCIAGRQLSYGALSGYQAASPMPLCPVPKECGDVSVQNATAVLQTVASNWGQPGGFSWRVCEVEDSASDECDPTTDVTRDNALAFLTVFAVQCCAIALGHVILMWKLRRMVAENQQRRRRAMSDPRLEQRARRFVADAKAQEERERSKSGDAPKLSARARLRRAVIVTKFAGRAIKAAQEAPPVDSVDDVVLEISEAVAAHWQESLPYFVAAGTGAMACTFAMAGLIVDAQSA
jgi:hypothetical protein